MTARPEQETLKEAPEKTTSISEPSAMPRRWRLSPAALERYRSCPRRFYFQDLVRSLDRGESKSSPQLTQANAVHHSLDILHGLPVEDRHADSAERVLRSVWPQHRRRQTFISRDEEAVCGRRTIEMLRGYADSYSLDVDVVGREQWLEHRLENDVTLFGKIDRIDRARSATSATPVPSSTATDSLDRTEASGGNAERDRWSQSAGGRWAPINLDGSVLEIVDYKTGRCQLDPEELGRELAVQVYLLLAEANYGVPVERIRFIYLADQSELSWSPEQEDRERISAELLALTSEIVERTEFPGTPGDQCRFCPLALSCPDRQRVSLAEINPVEGLPF